QPQRDVHGVIEGQSLDRDERLVVIHGECYVVAGACSLMEQRVCWQWAARINALSLEALDCGTHQRQILIAERAVLAGMRIEPGNRKARARNAEALAQIACGDSSGLHHEIDAELGGDLSQWQMDCHRYYRKLRRPQHHHR